MSVSSQISGVAHSDHSTGALYVLMAGLLLSDIIPTPSDAWYFSYTRKLRESYFAGTITPKQYWDRTALAYYGFNAIWWILLFFIVAYVPGTTSTKGKVLIGLLGAGIVFTVLHNNIVKDQKEQSLAQEALIPKA